MKNLLLFLFFLSFSFTSIFSQKYTDTTSKRTYTAHDSGGNYQYGYRVVKIIKDTFLAGRMVQQYRAFNYRQNDPVATANYYIYQSGDTVYQFINQTNKYEVKFIFNLNQGDTTKLFPVDGFTARPYYVDTVFNIQIDGFILKQYEFKVISSSSLHPSITIVDRIGFINFFNFNVLSNPGGTKYTKLRCYSDSSLDTNYNNYPCTFIAYNDLKENSLNSIIQLYPNPAQQILQINSGELQIEGMNLFTIQGKEIPVFINQNNQLDVSSLPQGVYLLQVKTSLGTVVNKWIKE